MTNRIELDASSIPLFTLFAWSYIEALGLISTAVIMFMAVTSSVIIVDPLNATKCIRIRF